MSNASRKFRRQHQPRKSRRNRPRQYSMTVCTDPDPNCPTCRELMRQPGARWKQSRGIRTIVVPVSFDEY